VPVIGPTLVHRRLNHVREGRSETLLQRRYQMLLRREMHIEGATLWQDALGPIIVHEGQPLPDLVPSDLFDAGNFRPAIALTQNVVRTGDGAFAYHLCYRIVDALDSSNDGGC
jgi:hypothetical protein